MTLTVEDGTGLANADAYVSVADADAYVAAFQPEGFDDWDAATTAEKEVAIRQATQWLDVNYAARWKGLPINAEMALDWPRAGVYSEHLLLSDEELPTRLVQACVETAIRFLAGPLDADVPATSGGIRRELKRLGPLEKEVEYVSSKAVAASRPKIDRLLENLVQASGRLALA